MIAFLKANTAYQLKESIRETAARVHVIAGGKETREIRKSLEEMKKTIPGCEVRVIPELYHGEFSLNHPDRYVDDLKRIVEGQTR